MVQKYVWWDQIKERELVRREIRMPKALDDFAREVAKSNGVSVSGFLVGLLVHAADSHSARRLIIERVPDVRVTEATTADRPGSIPVPSPSAAVTKRWKIPNVL
ncbi:MAG: hypothetical protein IT433_08280 [Phycisphaerales bacterium]|nr:hypothetical protein [Phycisphaerales bacterium]